MKRVVSVFLLLVLLPAAASAELEVRFLDVGQGDCAIILCDGEVLDRLNAVGAKTLRTDQTGTIVMISDGNSVLIKETDR